MPVFLGVPTVPRGTTDLLDRRDGTIVDWKVMGWSSLKKFKEKGPSDTYRTQAHVYALGAERSEEHTSELQSLMRISYAVFCLKKTNRTTKNKTNTDNRQ